MFANYSNSTTVDKRFIIFYLAVSKEPNLKVLEGDVEIGSQYHFYMETLACIIRPIEDGQVRNRSNWTAVVGGLW